MKHSPTPKLGKPNRDAKVFTYSENKLLDQITTEIMQTWAKDLKVMRESYKQIIKTSDEIRTITQVANETFPRLEEFISGNDFLTAIPRMESAVAGLKELYGTLNSDLSTFIYKEEEKSKEFQETLNFIKDRINYLIDKTNKSEREKGKKPPEKKKIPIWKKFFKF